MRVLTIDDSRAIRILLGSILEEMGFDVVEAGNGREALQRLAENSGIELALVDWNMPVMNGLEFIQAVRAERRYDDVCLIMVTTESDVSQMIKALDTGANEYIMKPFTKEAIAEKLTLLGISES